MQNNIEEINNNACSQDNPDNEVEALSNNKVGVEIEPDVKENRVVVQICSCSITWNCFSYPSDVLK